MKKNIAIALLVSCAFTNPLVAEEGRYISIAMGRASGTDYVTSGPAIAGFYKGGAASAKLDSSTLTSIAIGSSVTSTIRAEISASSRNHVGDLSSANFLPRSATEVTAKTIPAKFRATSFDLIGFYDFPLMADFEPYLGLGAGVSKLKIVDHISTLDNSKYLPHGVGILGLNYKLTDYSLGFIEARQEIISGAEITKNPKKSEDFSTLSFSAGIRFYF